MAKPKRKLALCPFCGGTAEGVRTSDLSYQIICKRLVRCGSRGPVRETEYGAMQAWNKMKIRENHYPGDFNEHQS